MRKRDAKKDEPKKQWIHQYEPQVWTHVEGNNEAIRKCKQWIRNFQAQSPNMRKVLHLCGPEGCGKKSVARILLRRAGYDVITLAANEIKNHKGDKHRLDNFCALYTTKTTALRANHRPHALLIVNYGAIVKSDKTFDAVLQKMVDRVSNPTVPLVVTSLPSKKRKTGLIGVKTAECVEFSTLTIEALSRIARRILVAEKIPTALNSSEIQMFARYAFGDARQLVMSLEMFLMGIKKGNFLKGDVQNWLEQNAVDDEKQLRAIEYHRFSNGAQQTEEERIIGIAVGDKGGKRRKSERRAAMRTIEGTSLHFMPMIFTCYPECIPTEKCQSNVLLSYDPKPEVPEMTLASDIADNLSWADVYHNSTWADTNIALDLYGSISSHMLGALNRARDEDDARKFVVSTEGYKMYYGIENTITNQDKVFKAIRQSSRYLWTVSRNDLLKIKFMLAGWLKKKEDDKIVEWLFANEIHPDVLETFARFKGNIIDSETFTVTRKRRTEMSKRYEALLDANKPTVKRIEPILSDTSIDAPKVDRSNPFVLSWN